MCKSLLICIIVTAATALLAADAFSWNWHRVVHPTETVSQVRLSETERVALKAALSIELGPRLLNLSPEEQNPDVRIMLLDLNGDHIPEIIAQATSRFWCGATGNCSLWIFRKLGNTYESILGTEEINSYLGFTVTKHRSGDYADLIFNQHESATQQSLFVFKFRDGKYRAADCYDADWSIIGDEAATVKEPRITPCR